MIPGNVHEGHANGVVAVTIPDQTVMARLCLERPEWVQGLSEEALRARLRYCKIPPDAPFREWRDVISRAAYSVTGEV